MMFAYQEARTRLNGKLRAQKSYYDRRIKSRTFEIGDKVLWLRPRVRKLENVWKGPYVVINKLPERNYYTIERDGVSRRATAEQLRSYHDSEVNPRAREIPKASTSGLVTSQAVDNNTETECLLLTVYGETCGFPQGYENFRTFSSDEEGVEILEESDKRNRKAPTRFPEGQWI
eukprot:GHVR01068781.1.p1 GENE.GHVR01068781.1~~GHVR01068781.1.p1  ORF type:complete len:174 (+),score=2.94 GHVR01068781.1:2-523(+)